MSPSTLTTPSAPVTPGQSRRASTSSKLKRSASTLPLADTYMTSPDSQSVSMAENEKEMRKWASKMVKKKKGRTLDDDNVPDTSNKRPKLNHEAAEAVAQTETKRVDVLDDNHPQTKMGMALGRAHFPNAMRHLAVPAKLREMAARSWSVVVQVVATADSSFEVKSYNLGEPAGFTEFFLREGGLKARSIFHRYLKHGRVYVLEVGPFELGDVWFKKGLHKLTDKLGIIVQMQTRTRLTAWPFMVRQQVPHCISTKDIQRALKKVDGIETVSSTTRILIRNTTALPTVVGELVFSDEDTFNQLRLEAFRGAPFEFRLPVHVQGLDFDIVERSSCPYCGELAHGHSDLNYCSHLVNLPKAPWFRRFEPEPQPATIATNKRESKPRSSYRKRPIESKGKAKTAKPKTVDAED